MPKNCSVSLCKGNAIELGRLLAELQTKTIRKPLHGVKVNELNELKDITNRFFDTCKINENDKNEIRSLYLKAWEVEILPGGADIGKALIKMADKLYNSVSDCDDV